MVKHGAKYEIRKILYDTDFVDQQVVIRQRRYLNVDGVLVVGPYPPLVEAREYSGEPVEVKGSRGNANPIQDYRAMECCMNALTSTGKAVTRLVVIPYRPTDANLLGCVQQILAADQVVNGTYRGESHNLSIRRFSP
jgi:hypothetical protein